jgi:hypothetical protein
MEGTQNNKNSRGVWKQTLLLHKDWLVFFKTGILWVLYGRFFVVRPILPRNVMWLVGQDWAKHDSISWYLLLGSTEACSRAYPLWNW